MVIHVSLGHAYCLAVFTDWLMVVLPPLREVPPMIPKCITRRLSHDLAVDLGTANTLVYVKGRGVVVNEPSVIAIRKNGRKGGRVLAVGNDAKMMLGRTPGEIEAIRPLRDGVIAHFDGAETMLRQLIKKAHTGRKMIRPRIIVGVPSGITPVEKNAVRETAQSAGASEVFLIDQPIAAAIGAGLPVMDPVCSMVVDIGGGTTQVAVMSLAGIVYSKSVRGGGDKMDEAIMQYVKQKHNLLIGEQSAESIKTTIGSALADNAAESVQIKGRDTVTGIPRSIVIDSNEVRDALTEPVRVIVATVKEALEEIPPELSADLIERGIVLTGGVALLRNLDKRLHKETGLPVRIANEPLSTVALGAGKALDMGDVFRGVVN
jgi:rod shape-determining protein MreB